MLHDNHTLHHTAFIDHLPSNFTNDHVLLFSMPE